MLYKIKTNNINNDIISDTSNNVEKKNNRTNIIK